MTLTTSCRLLRARARLRIVIVLRPDTLMAPAPSTSWHILEFRNLTSSAAFSPSSTEMFGSIVHRLQ